MKSYLAIARVADAGDEELELVFGAGWSHDVLLENALVDKVKS